MKIRPVSENEADAATAAIYRGLREAMGLPHIPLFFQYLGAFPEYLAYLNGQILDNLKDKEFHRLVSENGEFVRETLAGNFPKGQAAQEFLERHIHSPELHNLRADLRHIAAVNGKLAFIFIGLREAVKGWAVAAKKLPDMKNRPAEYQEWENLRQNFVYGTELVVPSRYLVRTGSRAISPSLLGKYLSICRADFELLLKNERLLFFRVELEKIILKNLELMPHRIFSPINVVLKLTKVYPEFPDLIYLLSEHFPTYAMQRLLFTSWIIY